MDIRRFIEGIAAELVSLLIISWPVKQLWNLGIAKAVDFAHPISYWSALNMLLLAGVTASWLKSVFKPPPDLRAIMRGK